ncbi:DUF4190 domain-containing protein [Streptomyces sp. NPDC000151]|uniref:DUF4190 domain-containing protein n=1 Tax=Streptomyces sp. NPDC000151 TaxID=3154244 RepID=UPI003318AEC5
MTTLTHRAETRTDEPEAHTEQTEQTEQTEHRTDNRTAPDSATTSRRKANQADGMAVASFILGLVGLLVMNVVLGPLSLILGALALFRGTDRRGRALLGMTLGVADLIVLAALVTTDGTVSWNFPT